MVEVAEAMCGVMAPTEDGFAETADGFDAGAVVLTGPVPGWGTAHPVSSNPREANPTATGIAVRWASEADLITAGVSGTPL
jgi:hypothetical protein